MSARPFTPSPYQQRFFDWLETRSGSCVLVAVAGSGKTTSVVRSLTRVPESAAVKLLAFNTTIAQELSARVEDLRKETGRAFAKVEASTFHSMGLSAVRKHLRARGVDVKKPDSNKVRNLLREFLSAEELELYGDFAAQLVGLAQGEGVGALVPDLPDTWWKLINHHDLFLPSESATEERGVEIARMALTRSEIAARQGNVDFNDMLYLVVKWKLRLWQHDYVYVDEAQDTNALRRALARLALRPSGRLIAVGDPRQAIYGFTGASHDAIELIKSEFNAIELPLTVSYRCCRSVVELARGIVPYLEPHDAAPEGVVETLECEKAIAMLAPTDAVLCRNTAPLVKLAYQLIGRGIGCQLLGRDIGTGLIALIKKMRAKTVDSLEIKLVEYRDRETAKFVSRGQELKAAAVEDRVACIEAVIHALDERQRTVSALIEKIGGMFEDRDRGVLTLCTVHKAKGKEWHRVAILAPQLMPSKWARQDWMMVQEKNVQYVAYTRAKEHLIFIA